MNWFNNDKGFFQGGKSFGGRGLLGEDGVLGGLTKKFQSKPCEGIPGVCPYSCQPLQTPTEKQTGVSDAARAEGAPAENKAAPQAPMNPQAGALGMGAPQPTPQTAPLQRRML